MLPANAISTTPVNSSKLAAIGYDENLFILRAVFKPSNAVYDYFDVEPERFQALMSATSLGSYFGQNIAGPRSGPAPYQFGKLDTPKHQALWDAALATPLPDTSGMPTVADLNNIPGRLVEMPRATPATAAELPQQSRRPAPLPTEPTEVIPEVVIPSDQTGLEARASDVVIESTALVVRNNAPGARAVLADRTPAGYGHAVAMLVAKKEEKKRALAEVAKIKNPATEAWKAACAFENRVAASYDVAITALDQAVTGYRQEVQAAEREADAAARRQQQAELDAKHAEESAAAAAQAKREAENLRAAGQHEVAAEVEARPAYVPQQVAAPVVSRTVLPTVQGARVTKTWKFRVDDASLIPRFFASDIRAVLAKFGLTTSHSGAIDQSSLEPLAMELGRIFSALYSVDEVKIGGRVRPLKDAAVDMIPGVTVYADEKTGGTGR